MLSLDTMYAALPARDIKEAMEFYGNTLGLTLVDQNEKGTWYVTGTCRIVLYYSKYTRENENPAAVWEVSDPKAVVKALRRRGVQFVKRELEGSKREGYVNHFPSFDVAWFRDPSGNLICITHHL